MKDKHLNIEIDSCKELVLINQKNIIKNIIICFSCSYLCIAFCYMYVRSVLRSNIFVSIIPVVLFVLFYVYSFKSYNKIKTSNKNILVYKNKIKSLSCIL